MDVKSFKGAVYDNAKSALSQMTKEISKVKSIIRSDNDKGLKRLLEENSLDVNMALAIENGPDHNLLTMACTMGSIKCIKVLLDSGADINNFINIFLTNREKDKFYATFCRACAMGSTELLRLLIDRGLKVDDTVLFSCFDSLEHSPLKADKRQAMAALLIELISNIAYKEHGHTFLHRVCSIGGVDNVKAVLERGVDRDAVTGDYLSSRDALGVAAANGYLDIVNLLLGWDKGDPIKLGRANKALIDAAKYRNLKVVKVLTEYGASCLTEALVVTVTYCSLVDLVEYLLNNGADVNGTVGGYTPLLALISNTRTGDEAKLQIARLLLARGADRDATSRSGRDSLVIAAQNGLPDFLELILEHDSGRPTINRLNEALLLSLGNSLGSTKCLLDHGAEVDATDADGRTPLMLLCNKHTLGHRGTGDDYLPTLHLLLERGADVSRVSPVSGNTALLYACGFSVVFRLMLSRILFEHGADVNQANVITGVTPLMRAALAKDMALVKMYLEHGADVLQLNNEGFTVLDLMDRDKPEYATYVELCRGCMDAKPVLK